MFVFFYYYYYHYFLFLGYIIFFKVLSIVNFGWVGLLVSLRKGAGGGGYGKRWENYLRTFSLVFFTPLVILA